MKKRVFYSAIAITLFCALMGFGADKFRAGLEAGYFAPNDEDFTSIYGSGGFAFGINCGYCIINNVELYTALDFYSAEGKTTISEQTVNLNLTNLRAGGFYIFCLGDFKPKVGAGLSITFAKEDNPWGGFNDNGLGWYIAAGVEYPLTEKLIAGVEFVYNDVKIAGDFGDENVGGISALMTLKMNIF
jgi:opacity protein-like surface antigen